MEKFEFQHFTKEEILEQIKKKAVSYVPEWRFDAEKPDIGTALAMVYGQMLLGTVKKTNFLPYKNRIAFFNQLEASLLPAIPSKGYVSFSVVNKEVEGAEVPAGMEVIATLKNDNAENVSFETTDDLFATPASVDMMLQVSKERDYIERNELSSKDNIEIALFSFEGENLQEHSFYFCHDHALSIQKSGEIAIQFLVEAGKIREEHIEQLCTNSAVVFEYGTENGYIPFRKIERRGKQIVFTIEKTEPGFAKRTEFDIESFWIRCRTREFTPFEEFSFDCLEIVTSGNHMVPDSVYANGFEVKREEFFPFGERFSDYNEVYFSSGEVFEKKGSLVTMAFNLDFIKVPLDYIDKDSMEWEWVMKKSDFKPDREYDVTIEEVTWEYFNGYGWTLLFDNNEYSDIFSTKKGTMGQYKTMSFKCPLDMEPILINAQEAYYIRARITKVNNLYKMQGNFIAPMMGNILLQYKYSSNPVNPGSLFTKNNQEYRKYVFYDPVNREKVLPFYGVKEEVPTLFLGFDIPLIEGPVKILFDFREQLDSKNDTLLWEYYNGEKWNELDLVDETGNMSKTGLVTIMGKKDFSKCVVYGQERYWIRISDVSATYRKLDENCKIPCLNGIYMNSVEVKQRDREETQYFNMEVYQKNISFPLLYGKILESQVYIDEFGTLSKHEIEELRKERKLFPEYKADGEMERAWVKWEEVEDFLNSKSGDRHYIVDKNEGNIRFGDGKAGRIPSTGKTNNSNIKVIYKTGGGEHTNVPVGAVTQIGEYIGNINGVSNPKMFIGGSDIEGLSGALERNAAILRHQNMAITTRDFEQIAKVASRNIQKVKCFAGYNDEGIEQRGAITLVVLQKEFWQGRTRFRDIKMEVEQYMKDKMNTALLQQKRFYVREPVFVELRIRAEIMVDSYHEVFSIRKKILERLDNFINPLSGNFDGTGWAIGTLPNSLQIKNAISDVFGISYIKNIYVSAYQNKNGVIEEVDLEKIRKGKYILPISGEHEIVIRVP